MNLDGVFIDEVSKLSGPFVGVPLDDPIYPLYSETPPVVIISEWDIGSDHLPLTCIPSGVTPAGLPCKSPLFEVFYAEMPYGVFSSVGLFPAGVIASIPTNGGVSSYYQARTSLGVWDD